MTLTVNRTEEQESNWADLLDGLRYDGFRRSVAPRRIKPEILEASAPEDAADGGGAKRNPTDPEPS